MKRYVSVLMLYVRSSFYKVLFAMLLLAGMECAVFGMQLHKYLPGIVQYRTMGLETLIGKCNLHYMFFFALIFLVASPISNIGCHKDSKAGYTLRRLAITERETVLVQWLYNTLCMILFWLFQTLAALGLCGWFLNVAPAEMVNHQTLVLAFYREDFLHNILPLADWSCWLRNFVLFATTGLMYARFTYLQRREKKAVGGTVFMIWLIGLSFFSESGRMWQYNVFTVAICGLILFFSLIALKLGDDEDDEQEQNDQVKA